MYEPSFDPFDYVGYAKLFESWPPEVQDLARRIPPDCVYAGRETGRIYEVLGYLVGGSRPFVKVRVIPVYNSPISAGAVFVVEPDRLAIPSPELLEVRRHRFAIPETRLPPVLVRGPSTPA